MSEARACPKCGSTYLTEHRVGVTVEHDPLRADAEPPQSVRVIYTCDACGEGFLADSVTQSSPRDPS